MSLDNFPGKKETRLRCNTIQSYCLELGLSMMSASMIIGAGSTLYFVLYRGFWFLLVLFCLMLNAGSFPGGLMVNNLLANAGDTRDVDLTLGGKDPLE